MNTNKKLKVAFICHVCNPVIRQNVPLRDIQWINRIKSLFGMPLSNYQDYSVWHTQLFERAALFEDIELHVIIPFTKLACRQKNFEYNGVYYHVFIDERASLFHKFLGKYMDITKRYRKNTENIVRIIYSIEPDVINMIGAEGPFYNSAALAINTEKYPLMLTLQTAMSDPDFRKNYPIDDKDYNERTQMEQAIFRHCHYIAHDSSWYREIAKKYNPNALFVRYSFLMPEYAIDTNVKKEYDFVYYAADISKAGIDAVEAFGRAYQHNNNISLNIVGGYSEETYNKLCGRLRDYGCEDRVVFSGYFPSHEVALKQVVKSRFALVPIKIDLISGTITESIKLGLPIITFRTKGTPQMNSKRLTVLLSDIGDYDDMACNMLRLLDNPELGETMKKNAKAFIDNIWDSNASVKRLSRVYHAVYENFHYGTEIPSDLMEAVY